MVVVVAANAAAAAAAVVVVFLILVVQGSLKDTICPRETWLFQPKSRDNTIYKAMFRCIM